MPDGRQTGRIGEKYQLDYYRHSRPARSWKWPASLLAAGLALGMVAGLYAFRGEQAFQAAPVAPVHASFGNDCRQCHDRSWQPAVRLATADEAARSVSNASCQHCHADILGHQTAVHGANPACAACHAEHRPQQGLLSVADSHCTVCHADLARRPESSGIFASAIESFTGGDASHPEFAILRRGETLPAAAHGVNGVAIWRSARSEAAEEASGGGWIDPGGVKFNHAVHLPAEGVLGPERKPTKLECQNCHVEDASGEYMLPINYETHCASCHPLRLAGDFARLGVIPHENPETVRSVVRERLAQAQPESAADDAAAFGAGDPPPAQAPPQRSLLPVPNTLSFRSAGVVDAQLAEADHAIFGLEAKGSCRKCHDVVPDGAEWKVLRYDSTLVDVPLEREPQAMIPERWFRHARFSHRTHRSSAKCDDCHGDVAKMSSSGDVMLPGIDACRRCHGATTAVAGAAGDRCTMCHDYHFEGSAGAHGGSALAEALARAGLP